MNWRSTPRQPPSRPAPLDRPGIIAPPPLLYLLSFGAGLWLQHRLPLSLELGGWAPWLGWPLVAVGVLGFVLALRALGRQDEAAQAEAAYQYYQIDESAQELTRAWRLEHPDDNRETQKIHVHTLSSLPAPRAKR